MNPQIFERAQMQLPEQAESAAKKSRDRDRGKSVNLAVGQRIRSLREQKGITQEAMGNHLNVAQTMTQKFEIGMCFSNIYRLLDICAVLGCTLNDLAATIPQELIPGYGVDTYEARLMRLVHEMDASERKVLIGMLEYLSKEAAKELS